MELNETFKEFHLENDPTCLYQVALAIQRLQKLYGKVSKITGRGPAASKVWNLLKRLDREEEEKDIKEYRGSNTPVRIDHLLLIDRSIDLLSPLVTQLTYEGLIDEIYNIHCSKFICLSSNINFLVVNYFNLFTIYSYDQTTS